MSQFNKSSSYVLVAKKDTYIRFTGNKSSKPVKINKGSRLLFAFYGRRFLSKYEFVQGLYLTKKEVNSQGFNFCLDSKISRKCLKANGYPYIDPNDFKIVKEVHPIYFGQVDLSSKDLSTEITSVSFLDKPLTEAMKV